MAECSQFCFNATRKVSVLSIYSWMSNHENQIKKIFIIMCWVGFFFLESFHLLILLPLESRCLTIIIFVPAKHLESEFAVLPEIESESSRLRAIMGGRLCRQRGQGEPHRRVPRVLTCGKNLTLRDKPFKTLNIHASLHHSSLPWTHA